MSAPSLHNAQPWRFRALRETGTFELYADRLRAVPAGRPCRQGAPSRLPSGAVQPAGRRCPPRQAPPGRPPARSVATRSARGRADDGSPVSGPGARRVVFRHQPAAHEPLPLRGHRRTGGGAGGPVPGCPSRGRRVGLPRSTARPAVAHAGRGWTSRRPGPWQGGRAGPLDPPGPADRRHRRRRRSRVRLRAAQTHGWSGSSRLRGGLPGRGQGLRRFRSGAAACLLGTAGDEPVDWLHAGQALERVLLLATRRGLVACPTTEALECKELRWTRVIPCRPWPTSRWCCAWVTGPLGPRRGGMQCVTYSRSREPVRPPARSGVAQVGPNGPCAGAERSLHVGSVPADAGCREERSALPRGCPDGPSQPGGLPRKVPQRSSRRGSGEGAAARIHRPDRDCLMERRPWASRVPTRILCGRQRRRRDRSRKLTQCLCLSGIQLPPLCGSCIASALTGPGGGSGLLELRAPGCVSTEAREGSSCPTPTRLSPWTVARARLIAGRSSRRGRSGRADDGTDRCEGCRGAPDSGDRLVRNEATPSPQGEPSDDGEVKDIAGWWPPGSPCAPAWVSGSVGRSVGPRPRRSRNVPSATAATRDP